MGSKAQYKTKQRDELRAFLERTPGKHITAGDVCEYFRQAGTPIGVATVYRQLEKMVDEGIVSKYSIDAGSPACFEYMGTHLSDDTCYHCKCQVCGKLIHMHCDELKGIQQHIMEHHGFSIDPMRTVFFGVCQECAGEQA